MNRDDIIRMAREAGDYLVDKRGRENFIFDCYGIERFASLVAAKEREECAHICDHIAIGQATGEGYDAAFDCGFKIRARGSNV